MNLRLLSAVPLLLLACACQQTSEATFTVEVRNLASTPLSVGFTKTGPPQEDGWTAPQEVPAGLGNRHWGTLVEPGHAQVLGPITGHFNPGVYATLRVYAGNETVDNLLAYGKSDPDRLDIPLWPGRSTFVITNPGKGPLVATPLEDRKAPAPGK